MSFYSLAYVSKQARKKEDSFNYAISGGFNGGVLTTALGGYKRGLIGVIGGIAVGGLGKIGSDYIFDMLRASWINYRRNLLQNSFPRKLTVRRGPFLPPDPKNNHDSK